VRATQFGHRALAFQDLTQSQEQRLGRYVAELQRLAAAGQ
jgi:hypothetical protein